VVAASRPTGEAAVSERPVIAVGVDESESSRRALAWAAQEAVRRGGTLHVITAWTWDPTEGTPLASADPTSLLETAERVQEEAITQVLDPMHAPPPVTRSVARCTAAEALVGASKGAALVVVGTHGRGPVRSLLLGSVSLSVIKHATCPVVVMPPDSRTTGGTGPALSGTA